MARIDPAPAHSLLRAIDAQRRAQGAGVRVPETVAHDATDAGVARYVWSVETFVPGNPFDHHRADMPDARTAIVDLGAHECAGTPAAGPVVLGDLDGTGHASMFDLIRLLGAWGPCGGGCCLADLTLDGIVDAADHGVMFDNWGP